MNMETIKRLPTHPGEVLKEELAVREISQRHFAECIGISYTMLNEILNGKRAVTNEFALIVEAALGINPEMLMNMQNRYNMAQARMKPTLATRLEQVRRICASWVL